MDKVVFGRFLLDRHRRALLVDGRPVELQSRPFDILALLIDARDRVVGRDEIMARVWQGQAVAESNLTVQMSILRRTLADCGASGLIITVPGRGYRFVAEVTEAPVVAEALAVAPPGILPVLLRRRAAILGGLVLVLAGGGAWLGLARPPAPLAMAALVKVEVDPDTVGIRPGGVTPVDYLFSIQNQVDLQLETEDIQFYLTSGEKVGAGNVGGRIWRGSFPIQGGTTGIYHNHIYLPVDVAAAGLARGGGSLQLKHVFHLRDARGREVTVPAVLRILISP